MLKAELYIKFICIYYFLLLKQLPGIGEGGHVDQDCLEKQAISTDSAS